MCCVSCGNEVPEDACFCRNCGAKQDKSHITTNINSTFPKPINKQRKRKFILVIFSCVLGLALIITTILIVFGGGLRFVTIEKFVKSWNNTKDSVYPYGNQLVRTTDTSYIAIIDNENGFSHSVSVNFIKSPDSQRDLKFTVLFINVRFDVLLASIPVSTLKKIFAVS